MKKKKTQHLPPKRSTSTRSLKVFGNRSRRKSTPNPDNLKKNKIIIKLSSSEAHKMKDQKVHLI